MQIATWVTSSLQGGKRSRSTWTHCCMSPSKDASRFAVYPFSSACERAHVRPEKAPLHTDPRAVQLEETTVLDSQLLLHSLYGTCMTRVSHTVWHMCNTCHTLYDTCVTHVCYIHSMTRVWHIQRLTHVWHMCATFTVWHMCDTFTVWHMCDTSNDWD